MELDDFMSNVVEIFDETDTSTLTPETHFKELDEWSSLLALSLIAMVDEEYDAELKGSDIREATTFGDLFEIIQSRV